MTTTQLTSYYIDTQKHVDGETARTKWRKELSVEAGLTTIEKFNTITNGVFVKSADIVLDNSTKCKSYRALVEIAAAYYNNNPEGTDWIQKRNEAEKRKEQYGCSDHILIGSQ